MRLAIADPPYLGRAARHYGPGAASGAKGRFGSGPARQRAGMAPSSYGTTEHPAAAEWDDPARHVALVEHLDAEYDGWACALWVTSLPVYLSAAPDARVGAWVKPRAVPGGHRIITSWEPIVYRVPDGRHVRAPGTSVRDVLVETSPELGHVGAKPYAWTRWVLALLGYVEDDDYVVDLFPGSGAVSAVLAQRMML